MPRNATTNHLNHRPPDLNFFMWQNVRTNPTRNLFTTHPTMQCNLCTQYQTPIPSLYSHLFIVEYHNDWGWRKVFQMLLRFATETISKYVHQLLFWKAAAGEEIFATHESSLTSGSDRFGEIRSLMRTANPNSLCAALLISMSAGSVRTCGNPFSPGPTRSASFNINL